MSPTELAMTIFRESIPDGREFDVIATQRDNILSIVYGVPGGDEHHHNLDLADPQGIEKLRLEIIDRWLLIWQV